MESIGTIMLTRGIVHLAATMLINESIRHIQRPLILGAGTICQLAVLAILCLWRPNDDVPLYYVITMCWSIANAILETLLLCKFNSIFLDFGINFLLLNIQMKIYDNNFRLCWRWCNDVLETTKDDYIVWYLEAKMLMLV